MQINQTLKTDLYDYGLPIPVKYNESEEYWEYSTSPDGLIYFINDDGTGNIGEYGELIDTIEEVNLTCKIDFEPDEIGEYSDSLVLNPTLELEGLSESSSVVFDIKYISTVGGSITGYTEQYIPQGLTGSEVTAVADTGYTFSKWSDGTLTASRTDTPTRNSNYYALFTKTITTENLLGQYSD